MNFAAWIDRLTGFLNLSKGVQSTVPGVILAVGLLMLLWARGIALPDAFWHTTIGSDRVPVPLPDTSGTGIGLPYPLNDTATVTDVSGREILTWRPTWHWRDARAIDSLRAVIRDSTAAMAGHDATVSLADSLMAHRITLLAGLMDQYKADVAAGSIRAGSLRDEIAGIEAELGVLVAESLDRRIDRQRLETRLAQLDSDLAYREAEFERLRTNSVFAGALTAIFESILAILLIGFALGFALEPLGRILIGLATRVYQWMAYGHDPRVMRPWAAKLTGEKRPRPKKLPKQVAFYVGKGVLTRDEHEKLRADYYRFAELIGSLIFPVIVLGVGLLQIGAPWWVWKPVLIVLAGGSLITAPGRYRIYQDKVTAFIRGKRKRAAEAEKKAKGAKGAPVVDTGRVEAMLRSVVAYCDGMLKIAERRGFTDIERETRQLRGLAGHLATRVAVGDAEAIVRDLHELCDDAKSIHNAARKTGNPPLETEARHAKEEARGARGAYANALARAILDSLADEKRKAKALKKRYGKLLDDRVVKARLDDLINL